MVRNVNKQTIGRKKCPWSITNETNAEASRQYRDQLPGLATLIHPTIDGVQWSVENPLLVLARRLGACQALALLMCQCQTYWSSHRARDYSFAMHTHAFVDTIWFVMSITPPIYCLCIKDSYPEYKDNFLNFISVEIFTPALPLAYMQEAQRSWRIKW